MVLLNEWERCCWIKNRAINFFIAGCMVNLILSNLYYINSIITRNCGENIALIFFLCWEFEVQRGGVHCI